MSGLTCKNTVSPRNGWLLLRFQRRYRTTLWQELIRMQDSMCLDKMLPLEDQMSWGRSEWGVVQSRFFWCLSWRRSDWGTPQVRFFFRDYVLHFLSYSWPTLWVYDRSYWSKSSELLTYLVGRLVKNLVVRTLFWGRGHTVERTRRGSRSGWAGSGGFARKWSMLRGQSSGWGQML